MVGNVWNNALSKFTWASHICRSPGPTNGLYLYADEKDMSNSDRFIWNKLPT